MPGNPWKRWGVVASAAVALIALCRSGVAAEEQSDKGEQSPGSVVVFPVPGEEPPALERTLQLLRGVGLTIPSSGTQFVDGRTLLPSSEDIYRLVGNAKLATCPESAEPVDADTLARTLEAANRLIILTEYEEAISLLQQARDSLACATSVIPRDLLYRLHFLIGVVVRFEQTQEAAAGWFRMALAIDSAQGYDSSFPPTIWKAYVAGQKELMALPISALRVLVSNDAATVFLDGQPIDTSRPEPLTLGYHLVQVQEPGGEDGTGLESLAFELASAGPFWLVDQSLPDRIEALRHETERGAPSDLLVDVVSEWAESHGQTWSLVMFSGAGGRSLDRVLFVDVVGRTLRPLPEWLTGGAGETLITEEGIALQNVGKGAKRVTAGWELDAGSVIFQPLTVPQSRLYGLEVGGVRTISGPYSAHVSLALGLSVVAEEGVKGLFTSVEAGVRRFWEWSPFGVYVEGALGGFKMSHNPSTLSLNFRPGVYYRIPPSGSSALGFWLGTLFVFSPQASAHWMGAFGFEYRHLW